MVKAIQTDKVMPPLASSRAMQFFLYDSPETALPGLIALPLQQNAVAKLHFCGYLEIKGKRFIEFPVSMEEGKSKKGQESGPAKKKDQSRKAFPIENGTWADLYSVQPCENKHLVN